MSAAVRSFSGRYRFLSNFYPAKVIYDGVVYKTVEAAYQAAKTLDKSQRFEIWSAKTPGEAKRLGKKLMLRPEWDAIKLDVMLELVRQKFTEHLSMKAGLLSTHPATLIENNRWGDSFWGVCNGVGLNHLGKILMRVRTELMTPKPKTKRTTISESAS